LICCDLQNRLAVSAIAGHERLRVTIILGGSRAMAQIGGPEHMRNENGPEFVATRSKTGCGKNK